MKNFNSIFNQLTAMPKRLAMVLTVLFTVGVGSMLGAEEVLFSQTYPGSPNKYTNAYNSSFSITTNEYALTYANINNGQSADKWTAIRSGSKSATSVATITSAQIKESVSKVIISFTLVDKNKTNSLFLEVSSSSNFASSTKITAEIATGNIEFPIASPAANQYYRITIDQAKHSSSNGFNRFDNITFYHNETTASIDPNATFSNGEYTIGSTALDLSTLWESNSTGAVTYIVKIDGGTGASISGTSFTATAAGNCTVQASQAAATGYNAITKEATITVNAAQGGGDDSGDTGECTWQLVTDASTLKADDEVIITASGDNAYAISTNQTNNNRTATSITKNGTTLTNPSSSVQVLTLQTGTSTGTWAFYTGNSGYLYAASSSGNQLKTKTTLDVNGSWTISISNGVASIVATGSSNRNVMQYNPNNGSPIFACYASASQTSLALYKKVCPTATTYSVTSTLSHVTASGENPSSVTDADDELMLEYSAESGWNLPANITVTMGGAPLSSETDYDWDNGDLFIAPASGFTGDIVVSINGWQQLATPQNLSSEVTATSATLTWDEVANAKSYLVTIVDGGDLSADVPNTQTSYTFNNLTPRTDYLWTVKAIGDKVNYTDSEESETREFTTKELPKLVTPINLTATDITATSATLTWTWNENTNKAYLNSYNVYIYNEAGTQLAGPVTATTNSLSTSKITGFTLTPATTYKFKVTAITNNSTQCSNSDQSDFGTFTTASATCTVTYDANGGEGTVTDTNSPYNNGATVTVSGNYGKITRAGYAFIGWNTAADGSGKTYTARQTFNITANTTLYAQWCEAYWKLVTDESELENDTRIVIAAKDYNFALSTTQNTNNRGQAEIIKKYNTITFGVDVQSLGLVGLANNEFALYDAVNNGYLYAASSTANQLKTGGNSNKNGNWDFSISKDGTAYILAQGTYTNNQLKYNAGSDLFSCYGEDNSQKDVVIYKEVCVQDQYKVTSNLTNATANTNPTTVAADATLLTLNYSATTGYLLPETITVQMGGATLVSGTDYTWNKETGALTITVTGFYGDIDVKIDAETDPCYGFAMSEVTATSTSNSITLSWSAVDGATGYNLTLNPGEFSVSTGNTSHTFEGLSPKTTYTWEVQAVKGTCQASKTGTTTTQKESFTVSWIVNGNTESPYATETVVDGNKITTYPDDPSAPSGCHEKAFVGWTDKPINTPTNGTPATLYKQKSDVPAITETKTLHAVWADKNEVPGEKEPAVETIISNKLGYDSGDAVESVTSGVVNIAFNKGNNSNVPKYYSTGEAIRTYGGNYFTITSENTITSVKLTFASGEDANAITTDVETYSDGTWTGSANSVKFTVSGSSGHRRISKFAVTYLIDGEDVITYSAYTTLCDECTPSESLVLAANASTADLDINGKATITFSTTGGNGGAITYTANPKNGVSWENGVATFTKSGEYEITASQEKNGEYCPTTSNTVNVTITAIPHLYFVTEPANPIVFDPVECGGNTRVEDKKSVSVQAYNLAAAVTAQVTGPYKIARTSGATLNDYDTKLTLDKNQEGHINGNYDDVYILSFPPAGSSEPTEGTLTFTTTNGNELTVSLSTPTITCTPCTLTFNDRGIKTTQEYYAGTEVPEPATPTGVCGEYEFDGWALAKVESGSTTYAKVEFPYIMPANNQTILHAVYRYTEGPTNEYELVTEIESGKNYVIAAYDQSNGDFALTNQESNTDGKFNSELVECDANNIITTDNSNIIWTVTGNDEDGYEFYNSAVQKYIEMYRYDGKSLLRLVDNCVNPFYVNIEKDLNNDVTVDITSPEVDATYNVFSFYEQLFNVYKDCDYNIYFYEQTATSLYTTTPDCHPSVTLTSDGEVYVTATNGRGIMAATPLTLTTTDLAPNTEIAISSNSNDIYFSTERNTNFAMVANQPQRSLTLTTNEGGELEKPLYIHYKPSADGNGTPAEVVVTADVSTHNPPFTAQKTIHVRNLPAKFVIATKAGATWYALPANMSGATNPAAVVIEVDETTMTATAPNTIPYTLFPVKTTNGSGDRYTQYGDRVRFSAINYEYRGLWANNNATEQTIRNFAVIDAIGDDGEAAYEWKVTTTVVNGQWQYTLYSDQTNNQNHLCYSMNQENPAWGTYASNEAKYQLYFLPIKAETTPFDYQVVEWYPNKVLIQTSTVLSSLTAKIAGQEIANIEYTQKDANQYEVTGLPLLGNSTKALTLEFVLDAVTHSGTHTIPVMLSGGEHKISDLSEIGKEIYNYTNLVVRDGATLTIDGTTKADNTFYDVTIYPTAKISVPEGKQLSVHRMTFIGGITEVYDGANYTLNKYGIPELSLKGNLGKTVTTMDYVMRVDLDQMYQMGVPYDVNLGEITYWDGTEIKLGDALYVSAYDGQARANRESKTWVYETDFATKFGSATLKAGVGYTISAEPQTNGDKYAILRLPMKSNISSGSTEAAKTVAVKAYDNEKGVTITANHKGWNYLSNPYMTSVSGGEADSKLVVGYLQETGTGPWEWVETTQRYVTIPHDNGQDYYQMQFSNAVLKPFKSFFVQIAEAGELSFALASRQNAPARYMEVQTEQEVEFEILLSNEKQSDNTGLLIAEKYSPAYEINADLEKMTGSMSVYTIYGGHKLAYNALSPSEAKEWIPLGYIVPTTGEYTFELDEQAAVEDIVHIYLIDYETGAITDLLDNTYTFDTSVKKSESRFAINVVLRSDAPGTATGIDNMRWSSDQPQKFIYNGMMYILHNGTIYDANGQQVKTINK